MEPNFLSAVPMCGPLHPDPPFFLPPEPPTPAAELPFAHLSPGRPRPRACSFLSFPRTSRRGALSLPPPPSFRQPFAFRPLQHLGKGKRKRPSFLDFALSPSCCGGLERRLLTRLFFTIVVTNGPPSLFPFPVVIEDLFFLQTR